MAGLQLTSTLIFQRAEGRAVFLVHTATGRTKERLQYRVERVLPSIPAGSSVICMQVMNESVDVSSIESYRLPVFFLFVSIASTTVPRVQYWITLSTLINTAMWRRWWW